MRDEADVVIVGAGIMGLAIGYNLAAHHGLGNVTIVDRSYVCGGASGRNGGGVRVQNDCGLLTRMLTPREARTIVPELDIDGIVAASFNPDDGVVFPWPFLWGYAEAAKKLGVEVATFTDVIGFETTGRRIDAVVTNRGTIRTHRVVNAAGAWSA